MDVSGTMNAYETLLMKITSLVDDALGDGTG